MRAVGDTNKRDHATVLLDLPELHRCVLPLGVGQSACKSKSLERLLLHHSTVRAVTGPCFPSSGRICSRLLRAPALGFDDSLGHHRQHGRKRGDYSRYA